MGIDFYNQNHKISDNNEIGDNINLEEKIINQNEWKRVSQFINRDKINIAVDLESQNKVKKCVCQIIKPDNKEDIKYGTGFFMIYKIKKYLVTCNHLIDYNAIKFEVKIWS